MLFNTETSQKEFYIDNLTKLISSYPRERYPLSPAHEKIFDVEYKMNREGSNGFIGKIVRKLEEWMHVHVAKYSGIGSSLEVGAGTLNHLQFEDLRQAYDIVEPYELLYSDKTNELSKIRDVYSSIASIPIDKKYSRVISIAVLEHMTDLPSELEAIYLRLKDGGVFQAAIPSEGGFLWGISWRLTTAISYKLRTGLSYASIMKHEHLNNADEILLLINHYFSDIKIKRFPFNNSHLSFYTYIEARK
ncbi:MAG: hypothetical protein Q8R79_08600 [Legionellaceae bacterium]|nr:hypothetical protein [Legionellaceae bacterium]